jgi:hypothetical protein
MTGLRVMVVCVVDIPALIASSHKAPQTRLFCLGPSPLAFTLLPQCSSRPSRPVSPLTCPVSLCALGMAPKSLSDDANTVAVNRMIISENIFFSCEESALGVVFGLFLVFFATLLSSRRSRSLSPDVAAMAGPSPVYPLVTMPHAFGSCALPVYCAPAPPLWPCWDPAKIWMPLPVGTASATSAATTVDRTTLRFDPLGAASAWFAHCPTA